MIVSRPVGSGGCVYTGGVPDVRDPLADVCRLSAGRLPSRAELRAVCVHPGSHHSGAQLRHHARDASQQTSLPQARGIHHAVRLDICYRHGSSAPSRCQRLPQVRYLPTVRDQRNLESLLRRLPYVHQRRCFSHSDGVLLKNVLCDQRFPSVEL